MFTIWWRNWKDSMSEFFFRLEVEGQDGLQYWVEHCSSQGKH